MRILFPTASVLAIALCAVSAPAFAQADRYGGVNTYAPAMAQQQPSRVLSWPGKTIPAPPQPPQNHQANYTGQPTYGAQLRPPPYQQAPGAPPAPYAVQRNAAMYPPTAYAPPVAYYPYPQYQAQPGAQPQPYPTQSLPPQAAYPSQQSYAQPYQAQRPGQARLSAARHAHPGPALERLSARALPAGADCGPAGPRSPGRGAPGLDLRPHAPGRRRPA